MNVLLECLILLNFWDRKLNKYTHTHTDTHTQTDKHRHTNTNTHTNTRAHTNTHTHSVYTCTYQWCNRCQNVGGYPFYRMNHLVSNYTLQWPDILFVVVQPTKWREYPGQHTQSCSIRYWRHCNSISEIFTDVLVSWILIYADM